MADTLETTAARMVAPGKGILAIDESNATCNRRFAALGIPGTEEHRRAYRELLLTAPGISAGISGAILYDETIRQETSDGVPFPKAMEEAGILVGIKVDTGAKPLAGHPGETVTEGLDGLRERLSEYRRLGGSFAKWRAVIGIEGSQLPSRAAVESNAHALARYALLCQESEIVPIVEPEVLMEGTHSIDRCREVTRQVLTELFYQLARQGADMAGMVLKPSMVLAGDRSGQICTTEEVASATLGVLSDTVPASVPGVAFLSGGQSDANATAHLNQINRLAADPPWAITFSYGRALQRQALDTWRGDSANRQAAQAALLQKVKENSAAALGKA